MKLLIDIEVLRAKLNYLVEEKGLNNSEVLKTSQLLDRLLNHYHRIIQYRNVSEQEIACSYEKQKYRRI